MRRGHDVCGIDLEHSRNRRVVRCDIAEFRQIQGVFGSVVDQPFDVVYHLAAEFGRHNGEDFYEQLWRTNVIGTRNLLELQAALGFKLIVASSSEIYGEPFSDGLIDEEMAAGRLHNDYAITKWVNEQQCLNFSERHGNAIVRLRFFNTYGPGELYHAYRSVVCLFCYAALHGMPFDVYRNYHRVFMFLGDFIPTLANVCENFQPGEVYNVGGSEYRSVEDLAKIVIDVTGAPPELVKLKESDEHNTRNKRPDISKARTALGHDPKVSLEAGVTKTVEWMRTVYADSAVSWKAGKPRPVLQDVAA